MYNVRNGQCMKPKYVSFFCMILHPDLIIGIKLILIIDKDVFAFRFFILEQQGKNII